MENINLQSEYKSPYKNPYILQRIAKKDLKWTKKKIRQCHIIKNLENSKMFGVPNFKKLKNPFYKLLERIKHKFNYDFYNYELSHDYEREHYSENDNINLDINLEYLYVYDILPKEDIYRYHEGIIKYSEICERAIGVADEFSINRSFVDMANHNYRHSTHNLHYFLMSDKMSSSKWIKDVYIIFEQYSESFYLITYRLKLKEQVTAQLKSILTSLVIYEPTFIKSKNKRTLSANSTHFLPFNRKQALNDLILEIEFLFINELNKFVPCFLHRHNIISPTFSVYTIDSLDNIKNDNATMTLFDFFVHDYDKNKDNNIIVNFKLLGETDFNSCIISRSFFNDNDYFLSYLDAYFSPLAENLIFNTLSPVIEKLIIINQQKLNKLIARRCTASRLLKAKIKTLRELNIYKRLVTANQKYEENPFRNEYINNFVTCYKECGLSKKFANAFLLKLDVLKGKYRDYDTQINSLYQFYDDNLKAVESSTNIRLVRYTLILTAITLLATIFTILISLNIISIKGTDTNSPPLENDSQIMYYNNKKDNV